MSFLEESSATLQDVLAFIDAYEGDAANPTATCCMRTPQRGNAVDPRKSRSQSYRIRTEILRLRREAQALEARIAELTSSDISYEQKLMALNALNSNALRSKRWIETVLHEYRRRRESERTNRQLKALLDKQMRIIQASETAFGVFTDTEISRVFTFQGVVGAQSGAMDEIQIMASLGDRLHQLELDVDNVIHRSDVDSSNCMRQTNSSSGVFYESCSCLSLPISVELAETMLSAIYTHKAAKPKATTASSYGSHWILIPRSNFSFSHCVSLAGSRRKNHQNKAVCA